MQHSPQQTYQARMLLLALAVFFVLYAALALVAIQLAGRCGVFCQLQVFGGR